jgi:23S rRNA (cytidine1920-2'-O)/16S rRNA (cytidine1409-2'-O)-methyltransferase
VVLADRFGRATRQPPAENTRSRLRHRRLERARAARPALSPVLSEVLVDGFPRTNPGSLVDPSASISLRPRRQLRGTAKLAHALGVFAVNPRGRIAIDVGAAAGGFTQALLEAGAARVYAIDAGHGQLRGWLRQHPRVVNLERTNLAELTPELVPDTVELVSMDLSYLAIACAAPQLGELTIDPRADLVALVKPAFELRLASAPTGGEDVHDAVTHAAHGLATAGWEVLATEPSPALGAGGAAEWLVHARRHFPSSPPPDRPAAQNGRLRTTAGPGGQLAS